MAKTKIKFADLAIKTAGGVAGGAAGQLVNHFTGTMNDKLKAGIKVVGAGALNAFAGKSEFLSGVAGGLAGLAGAELLTTIAPGMAGVNGLPFDNGIGVVDEAGFLLDDDGTVGAVRDEVNPLG